MVASMSKMRWQELSGKDCAFWGLRCGPLALVHRAFAMQRPSPSSRVCESEMKMSLSPAKSCMSNLIVVDSLVNSTNSVRRIVLEHCATDFTDDQDNMIPKFNRIKQYDDGYIWLGHLLNEREILND